MRPLNPFQTPNGAWRSTCSKLLLLLTAALAGQGAAHGQAETEIYLVSLEQNGEACTFGAPENVTQNPGYDNQPAFAAEGALLFASTRNGQTDIARLDLASRTLTWLSDTPGGGEYSPLPMPGSSAISAIRLDTTGLQRLYEYRDGESHLLFPDLKVGYQAWAGPDLLVCTVLTDPGMDLVVARPGSGIYQTHHKGVGRALRKIPGTERISYTTSAAGVWSVQSLDPVSGATGLVAHLPEGVQDFCWLPDGSLLCGGDGVLRRLKPGLDSDWQVVHRFEAGFGQISRLAVNEAGTLLALVVEQNPKP